MYMLTITSRRTIRTIMKLLGSSKKLILSAEIILYFIRCDRLHQNHDITFCLLARVDSTSVFLRGKSCRRMKESIILRVCYREIMFIARLKGANNVCIRVVTFG